MFMYVCLCFWTCIRFIQYLYVDIWFICVYVCMCARSPSSGAEGSCGLVIWHTLGFNSFRVVVIYHLVRDFCQDALSQGSRGGLEKQTERQGEKGGDRSLMYTYHHACLTRGCCWAWCCQRFRPVRLMWPDKLIGKPQNSSSHFFLFCYTLAWYICCICAAK